VRGINRQLLVATVVLLTWLARSAEARRYVHEVLPGETISQIAKRYHVSPHQLRKLNKLSSDSLRVGRKLKITTNVPSRSRFKVRYTVKSGDNLASVARSAKTTVAMLKRLNPRARSALRPGEQLWVVREGPPPPRGGVNGLYSLESGPGFEVLDRGRAWGTMLTVSRVAEVLSSHFMRFPDSPLLLVGDISRKGGGFLSPHRSHRRGRDVDIRYPLLKPDKRYVPATADTWDLQRTWSLVRAFIKTGDVEYIFVDYKLQKILYEHAQAKRMSMERLQELFQYPRGRRSMVGIIRHEKGHKTHLHVRFKPNDDSNGPTS
jgi:LysM repeat protein